MTTVNELFAGAEFGCCPECGKEDGFMYGNGKEEWFYCAAHKTKWLVGEGLFRSVWNQLSDKELEDQRVALSLYTEVMPVYPINL